MAIKMDRSLTIHGGVEAMVAQAYGRVRALHGGKSCMEVELSWFKDAVSPTPFLTQHYEFIPSLEGQNFIAQAYGHLKTLPEFAGATDC